jgi:Prolipoprotein diacylglyceryl transferase
VPVVIGGVVGARVYHLSTGTTGRKAALPARWRSGEAGSRSGVQCSEGYSSLRSSRAAVISICSGVMDAIGPAVVVAQAIGRFGNYFNQELFGRPTTLPWGLEIDLARRPAGYTQYATFHPTFLYESVWCLLVFGAVVAAERRFPATERSGVREVCQPVHARTDVVRGAAYRQGDSRVRHPVQPFALCCGLRRCGGVVHRSRAS